MSTTVASPLSRRMDLALLVLRVVVGIVFVMHGGQKLFVFGLGGVTQGFTAMGVPMPAVAAPLVALVEFGGGLALIFGVLTRLAALGLAIDMLGAILLVHLKNGFFINPPAVGYEYALTLLAAAATLAIAGAGAYSVDAALAGRRAGAPRNS
jgi:putative oxidoreductase